MRTKEEIQQAHNNIGAALVAFHAVQVDGELVRAMAQQLNVLCWILGCPNQDVFACHLQRITALMQDRDS